MGRNDYMYHINTIGFGYIENRFVGLDLPNFIRLRVDGIDGSFELKIDKILDHSVPY